MDYNQQDEVTIIICNSIAALFIDIDLLTIMHLVDMVGLGGLTFVDSKLQ